MDIQTLYQTLQGISPDQNHILVTVISGQHLGEQLLISDQEVTGYCPDSSYDFFMRAFPAVRSSFDQSFLEFEGEMLLIERIRQKSSLVICGGGHVAIEVLLAAQKLNFSTTLLEDRVHFANVARTAQADLVICDSFAHGLAQVAGGISTYFVIATRGHRYDKECLRAIFQKPHAYIGMMGSRGRVALLKKELEEEGIPRKWLETIHAPIGLDIGAETPAEIAISIVAELIRVKKQIRKAVSLDPKVLRAVADDERDSVLCTIIRKNGSAPRSVGTRMLVCADRSVVGTIGGGCVEADVISRAMDMLSSGEQVKTITVSMSAAEAEEGGLVCGGVIHLLLQKV